MLITRGNNYGIDRAINRFQSLLYSRLSPVFGDWDSYPRVYKNKKHIDGGKSYIAEHEENNEYFNVMFNDNKNMVSFFLRDNQTTPLSGTLSPNTKVSLIVQCKLDSIYLDEVNRSDEKLKEDIVSVSQLSGDFTLTNIIDGVDNVYSEFFKDNLTWSNIEERHIVRFEYDVLFNYKFCIK